MFFGLGTFCSESSRLELFANGFVVSTFFESMYELFCNLSLYSSLFANSIPRSGLTKPMFSPCDPINRISLESIKLFILIPCSLET